MKEETTDREKVLAKIKKILALSRNNPSVEESASAAAKVQELLMQHNLSEDEVDAFKTREERITEQFYSGHRADINEVQWKLNLSWSVGKANLCKVIHHPRTKEISWIGKESNILIATFLFETLCADLERIADKLWKDILTLRKLEVETGMNLFTDPSLRRVHGKTWKKSFFIGAVKAISERLTANLADLRRNHENMNALVLTNDSAITDYVRDTYGRLGKAGGSRGQIYGSAYATGVAVGKRMEFKRGVGAGGASGPAQLKG
jgi:hypothetical protein